MAPSVNTQEVSNLLNINSILGQHFQNLFQNYVKFTDLQICTADCILSIMRVLCLTWSICLAGLFLLVQITTTPAGICIATNWYLTNTTTPHNKLNPSGKHTYPLWSQLKLQAWRRRGGREVAFWNWEELHWAITHQPLHFQRANPRGRVGVHGGYVVSYALMGDYTC